MKVEKVNLEEKLSCFNDYWNPRIIGELNKQYVKLVKFKGEFIWHKHDDEDEMFYVLEGKLNMELRDKIIIIEKNEFIIIPAGVEHKPRAEDEVSVMLFEPITTVNTGEERNSWTKDELEKI